MKISDITKIQDSLRTELSDYTEFQDRCVYKQLIPIPIVGISSQYDISDGDIEIFDEEQNVMGYLCLCTESNPIYPDIIGKLSDAKYSAYISEAPVEAFEVDTPYFFQYDYVVLFTKYYDTYMNKYVASSALWGAFVHTTPSTQIPLPHKSRTPKIQASTITFPTSFHVESAIRSTLQPYAFERFLKLFHLLELIYDWEIINRLRMLQDDLRGIDRLLSKYSESKEIVRLSFIIETHCQDVVRIASYLNRVYPDFLDTAFELFFTYEKDGNPLKGQEDKFRELMLMGGFSEENCQKLRLAPTIEKYSTLVVKTAAYWIYRIRSSIAHSRLGEYIMTNESEAFVAEFADPLLRELIKQAFSPKE